MKKKHTSLYNHSNLSYHIFDMLPKYVWYFGYIVSLVYDIIIGTFEVNFYEHL